MGVTRVNGVGSRSLDPDRRGSLVGGHLPSSNSMRRPISKRAGPPPPSPDETSDLEATNKLAVASIVLSALGALMILPLIGSLLGVVFGHVSSRQIKRSNGTQKGRGMAKAGLTVGYLGPPVLIILMLAMMAFLSAQDGCSPPLCGW